MAVKRKLYTFRFVVSDNFRFDPPFDLYVIKQTVGEFVNKPIYRIDHLYDMATSIPSLDWLKSQKPVGEVLAVSANAERDEVILTCALDSNLLDLAAAVLEPLYFITLPGNVPAPYCMLLVTGPVSGYTGICFVPVRTETQGADHV